MVEKLRSWIQKLMSRDTSPTSHSAVTGDVARQNRATLVAALREDVSRIQQEILALTNASASQTGGAEQKADSAKLSALERQLNEKQQELAKFQGRI